MNKLPFGFERPEDSPGFMLWQTTIVWQKLIHKVIEPYGISHGQFVVMALLCWLEGHQYHPTQILISKWSKLDKMTVSKALKKLAHEGLVIRVEHETDTRAKTVSLTDKGRGLVNQLVPKVEQVDAEFFAGISKEQSKALIQALKKLSTETHNN